MPGSEGHQADVFYPWFVSLFVRGSELIVSHPWTKRAIGTRQFLTLQKASVRTAPIPNFHVTMQTALTRVSCASML